jgi:hypothetical protein
MQRRFDRDWESNIDEKRKWCPMKPHSVRANLHRTHQWQSVLGETVEVWHGKLYRQGLVDATMPDASGLWIAPEGAFQREFIDAASGFEVWTTLYPHPG